MKRIGRDAQDDQNYDSFLDIVANLVGILVILIMVIGVRAREASLAQAAGESTSPPTALPPALSLTPPQDNEPIVASSAHQLLGQEVEQLHDQLLTAKSKNTGATREVQEMDARIQDLERRALMEKEERNRLQLLVSMAEKGLEARRHKLSENQQAELEVAKRIDESRVELASLERQITTIESNTGDVKVIEHHPTPIAKTVFGSEEHLRLMNGKVAYVPINQMTSMLRRDAEKKMWKLGNANQVTELIGPVDGFRMKYTLERRQRRVMTIDGARVRKVVELKRFVMVPESRNLGEPISAALQSGSQLDHRLAVINPGDSTITVWTYPESFAAFRQLKSYLASRGYIVAARPLPDGYPIGGSPEGSKSAAE